MNDLQIVKLEETEITGWDLDELKTELKRGLDAYAGLVYTDENIKDAKSDRATLNKVKKVIDDARKAYKSKCLEPYEALEPRIKELVEMVEKQRLLIDDTVKEYETRQKDAKEVEVKKYYDRKAITLGEYAEALYPKLFNKSWVAASTARNKYESEIIEAINNAWNDLNAIKAMKSPFAESLIAVYVDTLSLEQVNAKKTELEEASRKANLVSETGGVLTTNITATENNDGKNANLEDGIAVKLYVSQSQMNQITDFMKAIGVRYEFI